MKSLCLPTPSNEKSYLAQLNELFHKQVWLLVKSIDGSKSDRKIIFTYPQFNKRVWLVARYTKLGRNP
jgi:hypothetical protein